VNPELWAISPVVLMGLAAALAWGTADFGGGLTSRRAALFGVVFVSQLVGMALALPIAVARGEAMPGLPDVGWSVAAGVLGVIGILSLYRGLAVGRMGVVAPVTGVLGACVPVVIGIALEGLPQSVVLLGIALAIVAVTLVSRAPGHVGQRSGIELGIVAGLGIGLFNVAISRVTEGFVFGPLTIVRGVQAVLVIAIVVAARPSWRLDRRVLPAVAVIGILDMAGNGFFIMAAQAGPLAVAAVLSSLYPVATVILATLILRERLGRLHAAGIAAAIVAIALISSGSG
jgi:drug/metabolite transporter (DMT)-like permease